MQRNDDRELDETQLQGSPGLTEDLKRLYGVDLQVPGEVDRVVSTMARRHFAAGKPRRRAARWTWGAAAAAAVLVAVLCYPQFYGAAPVRGDVDGSGEVDILDAFALARMIREKPVESTTWDMTNDGLVDQGDVDAVAMVAVKLRQGEVQ